MKANTKLNEARRALGKLLSEWADVNDLSYEEECFLIAEQLTSSLRIGMKYQKEARPDEAEEVYAVGDWPNNGAYTHGPFPTLEEALAIQPEHGRHPSIYLLAREDDLTRRTHYWRDDFGWMELPR